MTLFSLGCFVPTGTKLGKIIQSIFFTTAHVLMDTYHLIKLYGLYPILQGFPPLKCDFLLSIFINENFSSHQGHTSCVDCITCWVISSIQINPLTGKLFLYKSLIWFSPVEYIDQTDLRIIPSSYVYFQREYKGVLGISFLCVCRSNRIFCLCLEPIYSDIKMAWKRVEVFRNCSPCLRKVLSWKMQISKKIWYTLLNINICRRLYNHYPCEKLLILTFTHVDKSPFGQSAGHFLNGSCCWTIYHWLVNFSSGGLWQELCPQCLNLLLIHRNFFWPKCKISFQCCSIFRHFCVSNGRSKVKHVLES